MPTPRRSPGGPADRVFSCRLTAEEIATLGAAASACSVKTGELFRSWIASGAQIAAPASARPVETVPTPKRASRRAASKAPKENEAPTIPKWIWCSVPGTLRNLKDDGRRRRLEPDPTDPDRFTAARSRWFFSMAELLANGSCAAPKSKRGPRHAPYVLRVYLDKPSSGQLAADQRERTALDAAAGQRHHHQQQQQQSPHVPPSWARAIHVVLDGVDPGVEAVRSFGLNPRTATDAALQAAFRSRAVSGHPDHGGAVDMAQLVARRDLARDFIAAR